jgi:hypothetical protein
MRTSSYRMQWLVDRTARYCRLPPHTTQLGPPLVCSLIHLAAGVCMLGVSS